MPTDITSAATRWVLPDPVLWHDGMLLLPQHFQQQALRQEGLIDYRMRRMHPFSYGIVQLAIDQSALLG
ncbi:type VI secretion system baseplate subunit TssK, partial [Acinetobacter baumannii]